MTRGNAFGRDYIDTEDICIADLGRLDKSGFPMSNQVLATMVDQLNGALKELGLRDEVLVKFVNFLHRDRNPNGEIVFFRVFKLSDELPAPVESFDPLPAHDTAS